MYIYPRISFSLREGKVCVDGVPDVPGVPGDGDSESDARFSDWVEIISEHRHHCTTAVHIRYNSFIANMSLTTDTSKN